MSTSNSPKSNSRLKKLPNGRFQISIYLPIDEIKEIDQISSKNGLSRSSIITQRYFQGKNSEAESHN